MWVGFFPIRIELKEQVLILINLCSCTQLYYHKSQNKILLATILLGINTGGLNFVTKLSVGPHLLFY